MRNALTCVVCSLGLAAGLLARPGACLAAEPASGQAAAPATQELIAFSSDRSGAWRIWTIRPDGSDMRQRTEAEPEENDVDPMFSPDGKSILFTSTRGGSAGVWVIGLDGSGLKRICDGDQAEWSPDGKQIALRRLEKIIVRDLEKGTERVLTPKDWPHCSGPAWSPDGATIAFACRWEAGNGLFTVPAAGGAPTKVYDQQGLASRTGLRTASASSTRPRPTSAPSNPTGVTTVLSPTSAACSATDVTARTASRSCSARALPSEGPGSCT